MANRDTFPAGLVEDLTKSPDTALAILRLRMEMASETELVA